MKVACVTLLLVCCCALAQGEVYMAQVQDRCTWTCGKAGDFLACDDGYALAGMCGSGTLQACDHNSYCPEFGRKHAAIKCCSLKDAPGFKLDVSEKLDEGDIDIIAAAFIKGLINDEI